MCDKASCLIVLFVAFMLILKPTDIVSLAESTPPTAQLVQRFLHTPGFGLEDYEAVDLNGSTCVMPNSPHYQTDVMATISNGQEQLEAHVILIDGKIWMYELSGELGEGSRTPSDCLAIAGKSLRGYQVFANKSHYNQLVEILPPEATLGRLTVKEGNLSVEVSCRESCSTDREYAKYTVLRYSREVSGCPIPGDYFSISISKSGMLTSLVDNTIYHVTTTIAVSKEKAIAVALPYIDTYARRHGQRMVAVNATLEFVKDLNCFHGDNLAYYPQWRVWATYDKVNDESVSEYAVLVWADGGQAYSDGPQGYYDSPSVNSRANLIWQYAVAAVAVFAALSILTMGAKRRSAARRRHK